MTDQRDESGRLWVVACCEPRAEAIANMNLLDAGIPTFWVHYMCAPNWRTGRKIAMLHGYFPGYIFAAVDWHEDAEMIERRVGPIRKKRGVSGVLWSLEDQHYLPIAWLNSMRAECLNDNGLHEPPEKPVQGRQRFPAGSSVRTTGAWDQFVSTVLADRGTYIEVEHGQMFGKPVRLRYTPEQVERA